MLSPGYSISPQELWNKIATPSANVGDGEMIKNEVMPCADSQ
jgi:hypothetical protein